MKIAQLILVFLFFLGVGLIVFANNKPPHDIQEPLIMGVFPRFDPANSMRLYTPITKHLSKKLNRRVVLVIPGDFYDFWEQARNNKFDIVHYNQYHYLRTHKEQGYEVIVMNEEQGKGTIAASIVVRSDSSIKSLADLRGKKILFGGNEHAMVGYIWVTYLLRQAGLSPADYQYRFEVNPNAAVVAAYYGLWDAEAAGAGDLVLDLPVIKKQINTKGMRHLAIGEQAAHLPWAVKGSMDNDLKVKIQELLLGLKHTEEGKKILKNAQLTGFARASDQDYDFHRKILKETIGEVY